jgi:hypothetical protein
MLFKRFESKGLAHYSYLIGDRAYQERSVELWKKLRIWFVG